MAALGAEGRRFKSCLPDQISDTYGRKAVERNGNDRRDSARVGRYSHRIVPDDREPLALIMTETVMQRFWEKVDVRGPDECWDWQASRTTSGYGRFKVESYRQAQAHRMALIAHTGDEPSGMMALHSCDRPICCNPAHLRWGTAKDNSDDKVSRARHSNGDQKGFRNPRCTLTPEQLAEIVALIDARRLSNGQIAERYGLHHSNISKIRTGNAWREEVAAIRDRLTTLPNEGKTK